MKKIRFTPYKHSAILLVLFVFQFSFTSFSQKDTLDLNRVYPIYSTTDISSIGIPTIRLEPLNFLVFQSFVSASEASLQKEFSETINRSRDKITQASIIPIGVLNAEYSLPDKKEKTFILSASPLQKDIFQSNVQFSISPTLLQSNVDNPISSIELSFDEGKSWKAYKMAEQLIDYKFEKIGETTIGIKLISKRGTYVTFTTLDIKQLQRPTFSETKRVTANSVKGGRIGANVNGAEYRIITGCDGIFDKPIIIAEGFDGNQDVNLDDLTVKYRGNFNNQSQTYTGSLGFFLEAGYDFVIVNYDDGQTWIQDNAQVLKAVINQVNATKVGNNKLIVIGESMSGLVARWALKEMENAGQNPNVSHFVAFDSPMRGANVPSGLIALRRWLPVSVFPVSSILSLLNDIFNFFPIVKAIDSPAAKQLVLTQQGTTPAPEYFQFQTAINNLGYPSQYGIKNIAVINGGLNGNPQQRYDVNGSQIGQLEQGDKIMYALRYYGIVGYALNVWTHTIGTNTKVFDGTRIGITIPSNSTTSVNLSLNRDRYPGGRISRDFGYIYMSFCFVPTYSSTDYRGTLQNDNDHFINVRSFINNGTNQVTNSSLTPFAAIYGDNQDGYHSYPSFDQTAFIDFAEKELGYSSTGGCIGCGVGTGLQANFYSGQFFQGNATGNFIQRGIDISNDGSQEVPGTNTTGQNFSARWEGSIEAPVTATYTFNMRTDDGTRVWFDEIQKVNDWNDYGPTDHKFQVILGAGSSKNIKIEWKQAAGGYEAKLFWELNGVSSLVPACRMFPTTVNTDCDFTFSPTSTVSNVGCGGSSALKGSCSGTACGSSVLTYSWNGNGNNYSSSPNPIPITLPSANGAVTYTLTASKPGCATKTATTTINVSGCGGGGGGTGCVVNKVRLMFRGGDLNNNCCYERLQGAKIQGLDGNGNWTDLYTITSSGNSNWQDFPFTNTTAYTSVRFVAGPNSYGELTELEFYNNNTKLSGTAFGTGNYDLALDGSTTTSWHGWPTTGAVNIAGLNLTGCTGTGGGGGNPACTTNKVRLIFRGGDLNNGCCYSRLVGAKIQGTNNLSNPWNDLYTITADGNSSWQDFPFSNPTAYNYVRFVAGPTSYGELTELEFYNNNTKLTGSIFGTDNFALALDGSLTTSWHGWPNTGVANYAGMQISGCTGTRIGVEEITLKTPPIRELEDWDVKISPNPTAGKVKVEFELSQATKVRLNIYDLQGKSLIINDFEGEKGKNLIELDLTDLQHGSYLLNIQTDKERSSKRVIRID